MIKNFLKTLGRYKMASVLNILGLGVAFAAFAVIMTQVHYDISFDGFHENGDRIFRFELQNDEGAAAITPRPVEAVLRKNVPEIEHTGLMKADYLPLSIESFNGGQTFQQMVNEVSEGFFEVFDFDFIEGDGARLVEPNTTTISRSMAARFFPSGDAVGSLIMVRHAGAQPLEVVAVYEDWPENSMLTNTTYLRLSPTENINSWNNFSYNLFVKLVAADRDRAEEAIHALATSSDVPEDRRWMFEAASLSNIESLHFAGNVQHDYMVPKASRATTYTLLSIAILVILIAAINFVNFATSMVPTRLRGVNTRRVLGSSVGAIRAEMIFESAGLAAIAFGLGMLALVALGREPGVYVTVMTACVALVTGVLAGIYPAWYIASFPPALVLKGSFGLSPAGKKLRTGLVSVQYVISLVLIIAALSIRAQHDYMRDYPLGFDRSNLVTFNISDNLATRGDALRDELMKNPSVLGVEYSGLPLVADGAMSWGREYNGQEVEFDVETVSPGFPKLLGLEVTEGRDFMPSDDESANGTFIFNETARKQYGFTVESSVTGHVEDPAPVVGFVRDFHVRPLHYATTPFALYVFGTNPWRNLRETYVRIAAGGEAETIRFIHDTAMRMDPAQPDVEIRFLDESVGNLYEKESRLAGMITLFSLLAVFISIIGVFGLVLFETQYRRKEIGLRRVHGARVGEILEMLNRRFVYIVLACFAVAAPVAGIAVARWMDGFAFSIGVPWWTFAVALVLVMAITILTVTLQALKAATENPVNSIKTE